MTKIIKTESFVFFFIKNWAYIWEEISVRGFLRHWYREASSVVMGLMLEQFTCEKYN